MQNRLNLWQRLKPFDGDEYNAIHSHVMYLAINKMYEEAKEWKKI